MCVYIERILLSVLRIRNCYVANALCFVFYYRSCHEVNPSLETIPGVSICASSLPFPIHVLPSLLLLSTAVACFCCCHLLFLLLPSTVSAVSIYCCPICCFCCCHLLLPSTVSAVSIYCCPVWWKQQDVVVLYWVHAKETKKYLPLQKIVLLMYSLWTYVRLFFSHIELENIFLIKLRKIWCNILKYLLYVVAKALLCSDSTLTSIVEKLEKMIISEVLVHSG